MSMFCYQCQETAGGKGCTVSGVCGKKPEVAKLQDLMIYTLKSVACLDLKAKENNVEVPKVDEVREVAG